MPNVFSRASNGFGYNITGPSSIPFHKEWSAASDSIKTSGIASPWIHVQATSASRKFASIWWWHAVDRRFQRELLRQSLDPNPTWTWPAISCNLSLKVGSKWIKSLWKQNMATTDWRSVGGCKLWWEVHRSKWEIIGNKSSHDSLDRLMRRPLTNSPTLPLKGWYKPQRGGSFLILSY